ncbi:NAD(P)H-dependent FMN reductase [Propionibacteriaceae bacterium ES.041]|uniref:NADPH-dependent FMN reductase n=1 Tax=Enemella evansiae TaxID=2016499 RepID=UPI000B96907E|nr:NAD(P)H-dependent oxidoreductase [Enemella evansiae]OYN97683.1 oxidoreductase [Enemella evansiae]PFG68286.1 NAD(P)H-dependent FMN reductase [Propionibacteriaceae bacterium ES.041]
MSNSDTHTIGVIIGSTRPVRIGPQLAEQVANRISALDPRAEVEVIDLREVDLPFLDEPKMPALGDYQHDHTKRWAQQVDRLDGVVLLTPQYNGGIPAPLKNAIDTIYAERNGLPTLVVSYGGRGGQMAADALKHVFLVTQSDAVADNVALTIPRDGYGPDGQLLDPAGVVGSHGADLDRGLGELLTKVEGREPATADA